MDEDFISRVGLHFSEQQKLSIKKYINQEHGIVECWKMIEGYPNYAVSNIGRIRNLNTGKLLKHQKSKRAGWYPFVNLYKNGERVNRNVHKLVAPAFVGKCLEGYVVHHNDGDRGNPAASNLSFKTYSENRILRNLDKQEN